MADIEIVALPIPATPGAEGWERFREASDLSSAIDVAGYGTPDVAFPAEDELPHWHDPEQTKHLLVALEHDRIVGRLAAWSNTEAPETAFVFVQTLPGAEGRGIGGALHERLLGLAGEQAWTKLITYSVVPEAPGERLASPTGFGSIPRAARGARFLLDRGWRLEQVVRASRFALPGEPGLLPRLRADAEEHAAGYRTHTWAGLTPEPLRAGMAELYERMTTDAPTAGLEEPPETWDSARVVENDLRLDRAPSSMLATAVEHVATGRLAGMTRLRVPDAADRAAAQWDTIVRREDRGHRLGMLLKIVNLEELESRMPGHPSVITWNAEENRPMLDVNEAIGFAPIGYEGAWRKDLA